MIFLLRKFLGIFGGAWDFWGFLVVRSRSLRSREFLAVGGFWGFWRKSGFEGGNDVETLKFEL